MKIPLNPKVRLEEVARRHSWDPPMRVHAMLPFVMSSVTRRDRPRYVHRPRSASIWAASYRRPRVTRITVDCWCGQMMHSPLIIGEPRPGSVICLSCEERALKAGQLPSQRIVGHAVDFSYPRQSHVEEIGYSSGP